MTGKVYLVGAGPGDSKLITLRAVELLKKADVVLYDRLVSKKIISMIQKKVEKVCVFGKRDAEYFDSAVRRIRCQLAAQPLGLFVIDVRVAGVDDAIGHENNDFDHVVTGLGFEFVNGAFDGGRAVAN